ncbi:hypothetical protein [Halovenus sp. HT40]|uniref:hypothetical protein n=1 Tax=Halovenus sp. HT40 TaxID=3126691 RepID=UPI00300EF32D
MADTWIGVTDSRPTPLLNSLIASIESGSTPDNILVFVPKNDGEVVNSIKELVEKVCQEYEIDSDIEFTATPSIFKPQEASQHVVEELRDRSDEDTKAVSISSGSRLINACLIAASEKLDHLYTLEGPDQAELESTFYPMIPRPQMSLIDFQENSDLDLTSPGDKQSSDKAYKITRQQLPLLFNALYSTGNKTISVDHKSPLVSTLYKIELDRGNPASIRFTTDFDQYKQERDEVRRQYGKQPRSELPSARSFIGAMTSSILEFENQDEISDQIDPFRNRRIQHSNTAALAVFDTNLIQYWPARQLGVAPELEQGLNGYAVITGVRDELMDYEGDEKINNTRALEDAFGGEFGELFNQPKGTPRQLRLGRQYWSRLQKELYTEKIPSDTGDNAITAACENSGFDLILFSNDSGFISAGRDRGLPSVLVDFPETLPRRKDVTWQDAATALYLHAVQFGILELPKVDLYGVWPRKEPDEWESDTLAVRCRSPVVEKQLSRYQNMLDAITQ